MSSSCQAFITTICVVYVTMSRANNIALFECETGYDGITVAALYVALRCNFATSSIKYVLMKLYVCVNERERESQREIAGYKVCINY